MATKKTEKTEKKVSTKSKVKFGEDGFPITKTAEGKLILKIKPSLFKIEGKTEKQITVAQIEYSILCQQHNADRLTLKAEKAVLKVTRKKEELEAVKSGKMEKLKLSKKEDRLMAQLAKLRAKKADLK